MTEIDGIYCRECGRLLAAGYSWHGYCVLCAEKHVEQESDAEFLQDLREVVQRYQWPS